MLVILQITTKTT